MNYITQLNGFFGYCERELSLTPNCVSLYVALLHINNTKNWVKEFTIKNKHIEDLIGIHRVKLDEARNKLKQAGLICYKKDTGNRAGTYSIMEFGKNGEILNNPETVTQNVTQTGTQSVTQNGTETVTQTGTQNKTLPINNNKLKRKHKQNDSVEPQSGSLPDSENADIFISFLLNDGTEYGVTANKVRKYTELYPAVDIEQTLRNITGWCLANPARRKTRSGVETFINRWLAKEQNRGGVQSGSNGRTNGENNTKSAGGEAEGVSGKTLYGDYV